ncbi:MAG: hypothetical protein SFV52_00215 [Saprospiraceae bacterium]|nr:hypothetical protein [Saprospiraceae bacterium]
MPIHQMMKNLLAPAVCIAVTVSSLPAQSLPVSNIWLFQTAPGPDVWSVTQPQFLTAFNARGYNNQPYFATDDQLWITVQYGLQTDIHELNLASRTQTPLVETPGTSEYSAGQRPESAVLTVVRVEADSTQRLWAFPFDGYPPEPLFPDIRGVGYYAWLSETQAALFIVGKTDQEHTLVVADMTTPDAVPVRVSAGIGRCLRTTTDGRLVFVHKATPQTWFLKTYEHKTRRFLTVAVMPTNTEDFVLLPSGGYLCAAGSRLLQLDAAGAWRPVADLSAFGISSISRMAMNGKWQLAVVAQEP